MAYKAGQILVQGVGFNAGKYPAMSGRSPVKEHNIWKSMLQRCYDTKKHHECPTYKDCTVSENFKSYSYFYEWCQKQIGFGNNRWCLDKDILVKGNKVYSEDNCVFVPQEINNLFIGNDVNRGDTPIGVYYIEKYNKYRVRCNFENRGHHIGYFSDKTSAFLAYKKFKESCIKKLAEKYKTKIDPRAYEALMNYQVEITD